MNEQLTRIIARLKSEAIRLETELARTRAAIAAICSDVALSKSAYLLAPASSTHREDQSDG